MFPGSGIQDVNPSRGFFGGEGGEVLDGLIYAFVGVGPTVNALRYLRPFYGNIASATTEDCYIIPFDMTLRRFYVKGTPGPDVGPTTTYAIRKNGVQALALPAIATNANPYVVEDLVSEVSFLAGDRICFTMVHSVGLTTSPADLTFSVEVKPL